MEIKNFDDLMEAYCLIKYFDENKNCNEIKVLYKPQELMYIINVILKFDMFKYSLMDDDFEMLYSLISDYRFEGKININEFNNINELISLINDRKFSSNQFWNLFEQKKYDKIKDIIYKKIIEATTYFGNSLIEANYLDSGILFSLWEVEFYIGIFLINENNGNLSKSKQILLAYPYTECGIVQLLNHCSEDLTNYDFEALQALLIERLEPKNSKAILNSGINFYTNKRELQKSIENIYYCLEDLKKVKKR